MQQHTYSSRVLNTLGRYCLLPLYSRKLTHFMGSLQRARREQQEIRDKIVRFGAQTSFGRDFGFAEIRTLAEFRRQLPVSEFDHFSPYIDRVAAGEFGAMFPQGEKILTFVNTSATTGRAKIFPINKTWFRYYSRDWDVWGVKAYQDHPEQMGLPILQLSGGWHLDTTSGGFNVASISAMIERYQSPAVKISYAIPPEVKRIKDVKVRGYCVIRIAAPQRLGLISTVTPSSILQIAEWTAQFGPQLARDLAQGTLDRDLDIPSDVRKSLEARLRRRHPDLARTVETAISRHGVLRPRDLWRPVMISCWLGGTVGYSSRRIPELFGDVPLRDQGLLSSEGRHTVPLSDGVPYGPLAIGSNYYEFIPAEETVGPDSTVLEAHELEQDKLYRIIMTTFGGLYRYDIGDLVKCVGYMGESPLIEFMQKDGSYCDLEGEKLSAYTVCHAAEEAQKISGLSISCFTVAPRLVEGQRPRYGIIIETQESGTEHQRIAFLNAFDADLRKNVYLYGSLRRNLILERPCLVQLPAGAWREYIAEVVNSRGNGDSQYKHKPLVATPDFIKQLNVLSISEVGDDGQLAVMTPLVQ